MLPDTAIEPILEDALAQGLAAAAQALVDAANDRGRRRQHHRRSGPGGRSVTGPAYVGCVIFSRTRSVGMSRRSNVNTRSTRAAW